MWRFRLLVGPARVACVSRHSTLLFLQGYFASGPDVSSGVHLWLEAPTKPLPKASRLVIYEINIGLTAVKSRVLVLE